MKTLAADQSEAVKSGITAAITKLQAAGNLVENKTVTAADDVRHANDAMLESAHRAAQSLSAAVASARSKVAKAIEPKKVRA